MKKILLSALIVGIAATASAQTRTVAKTGTPDHATVAAALAFFSPDPDALTPNVIQITDSAVYDEIITINVPVTIEGTGSSRPTLTPQLNAGNDGIVISVTTPTGVLNDVTLRNLIILPSLTARPTDDAIRSDGGNLNILIEDVLLTQNNGSNLPVTTDGLSAASLTGATLFGDDGIFTGATAAPAGPGCVTTLRDVIVSHFQGGISGATVTTANDGYVGSTTSGTASALNIEDGCVFSFNNRLGIQANAAASVIINAPTNRVKVIGNLGFAGIWFAGAQTGTRSINGCDVLNTTGATNTTTPGFGWGIEDQSRGTIPFTLSNSIIAGNTGEGLVIGTTGTGDVTLSNVTIANNGTEAIEYVTASTGGVVTATDSIFAGNGSAGATQILRNDTTFGFTLNNCAVVTAGPQALTAPGTGGTGTITLNSVINADPMFAEVSNIASASFFDVQNSAYATAGTGSTPLKGAADFTPASAAGIWSMYN